MTFLHIAILAYLAIALLAFILLSQGAAEDLATLHWKYGHFPWVTILWWLLLAGAAVCWPVLVLACFQIEERHL